MHKSVCRVDQYMYVLFLRAGKEMPPDGIQGQSISEQKDLSLPG